MKSSDSVELSEIPGSGYDLEDYVAALFQSSGYYVEKNLVERAPEEILELDIVATMYEDGAPSSLIVEAKGGKWGYPDLFKVAGWMRYLGQQHGAFFVKSTDKDLDQVRKRIAPLSITLVDLGDFSEPTETFSAAGLGTPCSSNSIKLWRYSNLAERTLISLILSRAKSDIYNEGPRSVIAYHRLVNDGIFFTQSMVETVAVLYGAYRSHPKLSLGCARELEGGGFDPELSSGTSPLISQAMIEGEPYTLQASFFAEHRARLAILRGAVNLLCAYPDWFTGTAYKEIVEPNLIYSLPETFLKGLTWLHQKPNFYRYPAFWQQFLWGWGGFYLSHRYDEEVQWMSQASRIPVDEIPDALEAFDRFFPTSNGWFTTAGPSTIRTIKMMPMTFQGIGVYHRRLQYSLQNFSDIGGTGYTVPNLARWHNKAAAFLVANRS